ncbi:hypothetical protein ACPFDR_006566 [Pseudomonas aeruginosa]
MAAHAGLAAFLLAYLHAVIIDCHHAHRDADLWRTVAEHRYPQLVLQTGEQIHAVVGAFLPADLVLPDGAQVQRRNDLGLPVQIIQRDTFNGSFRGSKRESQKIPSFRMMKIQSTPRLT